ncbi:5-dehydro-4-deoxy-D-glucuronate isomerase [Ferruginibacter albus]|uniref:5-dehydro-4-deoxy-D-glucuronate isomerase n=1 Tax=Ferruginibacter albus TaxID=2875540 RepID=UPI001CC35FA0|nr:5-dehydro-4-deoxy-D-glucuronate isomerase [Ferruginibacter albus]UAY53657.1 5-dehydro-4-deoxy-D-glucuronate isomerase [Ferruginibacter albus]
MEQRFANGKKEVKQMDTTELRENFLIEKIFTADQFNFVYSHYDRVIIGGVMPVNKTVQLPVYENLKAAYFLERREIGIINIGGDGEIKVNDKVYTLSKLDCLYVGKGNEKVTFKSLKKNNPAKFYLLSAPAHHAYKVQFMKKEKASPLDLGSVETANQRTVYKYIHADGLKSCQLVMGLTVLKTGSVWNTIPTHTHDRRMEAYLYFDVPENHRVFHFMGEPNETRHILVASDQALISPPWSIHSGAGTSNYSFIWGMAGENYVYTDMDVIDIKDVR